MQFRSFSLILLALGAQHVLALPLDADSPVPALSNVNLSPREAQPNVMARQDAAEDAAVLAEIDEDCEEIDDDLAVAETNLMVEAPTVVDAAPTETTAPVAEAAPAEEAAAAEETATVEEVAAVEEAAPADTVVRV